ncbi:MAG: hypothetical protein IJ341_07245 [Bacteroidales bacterium]|nr:hypothetical protein [Bacteroidales bacterium]
MKETHIFNETTKRLDPVGDVCVFCGKRRSEHITYETLYKEISKTNIIVYRNVKFSKIDIGASICSNCKKIHKKIHIQSLLFLSLIIIITLSLIALISYLLFPLITFWVFIIGLVLLVVTILLSKYVYHHIEEHLIKPYNVLTKREGLQSYPIVEELLNNGYTFERPEA